ncbi:hypothetical protein HF521_007494 [Silurus meridionalis]|uniref:Ig-like domain-containing protein n=1 Tax=Silurus meridionalis TaxID=175797 RepID=A0A8T0AP08_SILME|nr:hypothetical protein HF521_007494 [Silurus meridionalis]
MQFAVKFVITCCLYQAVLCREFFISLPESIEALRGLCVLIPCSFDFKEQYDEQLQNNARGVWYKGDSLAKHKVFSSKSTEGNQINGKIIGDLYMKNCTTIFYNISESDTGEYYFRIVSGNLKYIYPSSLYLNVRATPISPSITLYKEDHGELMDQKQVLEGTLVRLMCSARSPCPFNPPTFTWNFLPEEGRQERYHNARFRSSQLNFKATHLHHGRDFTCTVTYQLQNFNKSEQSSFTLHVLYGPRNTSVSASPSASVLLGSSVSLSCSSDGNPAVLNYTWYRENGEQIGTGNHLTINTTDSPHSALYYCRAQNQHGDHNSSIHLDVLCGDKDTSSGQPSGPGSWRVAERISRSTSQTMGPMMSAGGRMGSGSLGSSGPNTGRGVGLTVGARLASGVNNVSELIGAAVGVSVMMMLCAVFLYVSCLFRKLTPSQSGRGEAAGHDVAVYQEDDDQCANKNAAGSSELIYSIFVFPNGDGSEIRGLSSLTAEYATINYGSDMEHQPEGGDTETAMEEVQEENKNNIDSKNTHEEVIYGNITFQPMMEETQLDLNEDDEDGETQPQTGERKNEFEGF